MATQTKSESQSRERPATQPSDLPVSQQIDALAEEADQQLASGTPEGRRAAHDALMEALALLPNGRVPEAAALYQRLGDTYLQEGDAQTALRAYRDAVESEGAIGQPAIHLRLGIAQLELGKSALATEELCRAYQRGGRAIFEGQDPKYLAFLETKILLPDDDP